MFRYSTVLIPLEENVLNHLAHDTPWKERSAASFLPSSHEEGCPKGGVVWISF
jgi:hypothetical protein